MTNKRKYNTEDGYNIHYRWANLDQQAWQDAPCVVIRFYPDAIDRFVVEVERAPLHMQPFKRMECFLLPDALHVQEEIREMIEVAIKAHARAAEQELIGVSHG